MRKNKLVRFLWVRLNMFILSLVTLIDGVIGTLTLGIIYPEFNKAVTKAFIKFNWRYFEGVKYKTINIVFEKIK